MQWTSNWTFRPEKWMMCRQTGEKMCYWGYLCQGFFWGDPPSRLLVEVVDDQLLLELLEAGASVGDVVGVRVRGVIRIWKRWGEYHRIVRSLSGNIWGFEHFLATGSEFSKKSFSRNLVLEFWENSLVLRQFFRNHCWTRELPGVALVNISNG